MSIWNVKGGNTLGGSLTVQGAKNAVLPIMAASILTGCETELLNVPQLSDVQATIRILRSVGCKVTVDGDVVGIDSTGVCRSEVPDELMHQLRSSIIFLGALLARCGEARLSMPGGCALGRRPVDQHLKVLYALGAEIEEADGHIFCRSRGLRGTRIELDMPSVGATENAMLAACAAEGTTVLTNAAREPEIADLQEYLRRLGANVSGAGTGTVTVAGFTPQPRVGHRIMPDRIVASTLLCAAAAAGGDLELRGLAPRTFSSVTAVLSEMGCQVRTTWRSVRILSDGRLRAPGPIATGPYPGFPTDAQPLLMAACLRAKGTTVFVENMFENRYGQAGEFVCFGADVHTAGKLAIVNGVERLTGAEVSATDLRAGAALVTAALAAEGESRIHDAGHIDRGYFDLDGSLRYLGAEVFRS